MPADPTTFKSGSNPSSPGRRLRALQDRTADPVEHDLIDEVAALEDRLLYVEAALAHICAILELDAHSLPDPIRPWLRVGSSDTEET